jgi:hypothetical protein
VSVRPRHVFVLFNNKTGILRGSTRVGHNTVPRGHRNNFLVFLAIAKLARKKIAKDKHMRLFFVAASVTKVKSLIIDTWTR